MSESEVHRLNDLLKQFRTGMLVTDDGQLRARPMTVAGIEPDNDIWFATSLETSQAKALSSSAKVLVTFQSATRYISLTGTGELTQNSALIDRFWSESWKVWYPRGKEDPNLVLLRVRIDHGEFWDLSGAKGAQFLWNAAKAYFSGQQIATVPETHGIV